MRDILVILLVSLIISINVGTAIADNLDKTPSWYTGSKQWTSISREGREQLLRMHNNFNTLKTKANERSHQVVPTDNVKKGEQLIHKVQNKYGLNPYYRKPSNFGSRMVIWFPDKAWNNFTSSQKSSVEAYMKSKYANWGIGVGSVSGQDILIDRLVVEH